jgi:SAM-dependent methyltransferase
MAKAKTHSSVSNLEPAQKLREAFSLFRARFLSKLDPASFDALFDHLSDFASTYRRFTGRSFKDAAVLEIGFGPRPSRLIALMGMDIDVRGIDLDMPMLRFSLPRLFRILRKNGVDRALKTAVRSLFFDSREQAALREAMKLRGFTPHIDPARFLVGDAATYDFGDVKFDFIYSWSVFEHIPPPDLSRLVERIAKMLAPNGIALLTPDVFTGITGGHLVEWYGYVVEADIARLSEPWEHLRKARYKANTYLNRLSRADYRNLFREHFEILEERAIHPDMGRRWLTPELRVELAAWDEDELFSNTVQFVLGPKA